MKMREVQQTAGRKYGNQQRSGDNDFLFHGRSRSQMRKLFQGVLVVGAETAGIVGTDGAELPTLPVMGDMVVVGAAVVGLTPALPIS
jgi:hypothetical protein